MPQENNPLVAARSISSILRKWRAESGLTVEDLAKEMGWSRVKIARLEAAQRKPQLRDVRALIKFYKKESAREAVRLERLVRQANQPTSADKVTLPHRITTREEFGQALNELRQSAGLNMQQFADLINVSESNVNAYFSGRSLPRDFDCIYPLLEVYGVDHSLRVRQWLTAFERVQALPAIDIAEPVPPQDDDQASLLFRTFIPSKRLYAAEASRLLSLFRDWLMATSGHRVRQRQNRTASGEMFEFYVDGSLAQTNLREDFGNFSSFLTLCSTDPSAAADMIAPMVLGRTNSADFVARFSKEVRRLQIDLAHERERRILLIRHSLEEDLVNSGVELCAVPSAQIHALIQSHVPGPSAPDSLALLTAPRFAETTSPVTLNISQNISQQFVNTVENKVVQSVRGTVHFGPDARELLALIDRFGGQEAPLLEAAVHELEDTEARPVGRLAAKKRLKKFLGQIAGMVHDVGIDLLEKYLESKAGI